MDSGCARALRLTFKAFLRVQGFVTTMGCQASTLSNVNSDKNINLVIEISPPSPWWRSISENNPTQGCLTRKSSSSVSPSSNAPGSCSPDGVDQQFLEDFHRVTKGGSTEDSSQYYCDKVSGLRSCSTEVARWPTQASPCIGTSWAIRWLWLKETPGEGGNVIGHFPTFSRMIMAMAT